MSTIPADRRRFTLSDLRAARVAGDKVAMLTCYDYTTARLMAEAGVRTILVGDSAGNVILGYDSTVPVSLRFMTDIGAAVRRGAPDAFLTVDMPFGSYGGGDEQGFRNVVRTLQLTGCDCIKMEVGPTHATLVEKLSAAGVAVMAHLGLRPQTVGLMGGYKFQGRTAQQAIEIVRTAQLMERSGAAVLLLEAVPPEVSAAVVDVVEVPVIGCGAGPACHGAVVVTHDVLGLTPARPRFAPLLTDAAGPIKSAFAEYVKQVADQSYPAAEHNYVMPAEERRRFDKTDVRQGSSTAGRPI